MSMDVPQIAAANGVLATELVQSWVAEWQSLCTAGQDS